MTDGSIHEQAMLLTSVLALGHDKEMTQAYVALNGYPEPPGKAQLDADHPFGSDVRDGVESALEINELLGTFVKHGALSAELVCDALWVGGFWVLVEKYVRDLRAEAKSDALYENFEALAKA